MLGFAPFRPAKAVIVVVAVVEIEAENKVRD